MTDDSIQILLKLKALSEVDSKIAIDNAKIKKLKEELSDKSVTLKKLEDVYKAKAIEHNERKTRYQREEKFLRDERHKLIERRKSLASLNNYKVQQAAEREIEASSKQIGAQEETLIAMLEEIDVLAAETKKLEDGFTTKSAEINEFKTKAEAEITELSSEDEGLTKKREELLSKVDPKSLESYKRIQVRYPANPVVALSGTTCTGCFLDLGPQAIVMISRGDAIVSCRGCTRFLYLEPKEEGSTEEATS